MPHAGFSGEKGITDFPGRQPPGRSNHGKRETTAGRNVIFLGMQGTSPLAGAQDAPHLGINGDEDVETGGQPGRIYCRWINSS